MTIRLQTVWFLFYVPKKYLMIKGRLSFWQKKTLFLFFDTKLSKIFCIFVPENSKKIG